jgi:exonuclease SbcD
MKTSLKKNKQFSTDNVAAVVITDTHLTKDNCEQVIEIFEQCKNLALSCGVKQVQHLGDIFTNRVGQSLQTLLAFKKILSSYEEVGLEIIAIPGNHDKTDLDSDESYLEVFSEFSNFTLLNKPTTKKINGIHFHFVPYYHHTYTDRLSEIQTDEDNYNILCTHQAINGVKNNDGTEVTDCNSPSEFERFDKVLVGHYHNASKIGNNIYYVGSAYQSNFGESIEDKGFTVIYQDGSMAKVRSKFKQFIKVKLFATDTEGIEESLANVESGTANYRFVFAGKKTDLDNLNLTKFADKGIECKFESDEVGDEILRAENEELLQFDKPALQKMFLKFTKLQGIDNAKRSAGLKFIKELI